VTTFSAAVIRSSIIAKAVGQMLPALFRSGLDANKFHCVGHSIGGEFGPLSSLQHRVFNSFTRFPLLGRFVVK
jgi:hypothetical protein